MSSKEGESWLEPASIPLSRASARATARKGVRDRHREQENREDEDEEQVGREPDHETLQVPSLRTIPAEDHAPLEVQVNQTNRADRHDPFPSVSSGLVRYGGSLARTPHLVQSRVERGLEDFAHGALLGHNDEIHQSPEYEEARKDDEHETEHVGCKRARVGGTSSISLREGVGARLLGVVLAVGFGRGSRLRLCLGIGDGARFYVVARVVAPRLERDGVGGFLEGCLISRRG